MNAKSLRRLVRDAVIILGVTVGLVLLIEGTARADGAMNTSVKSRREPLFMDLGHFAIAGDRMVGELVARRLALDN